MGNQILENAANAIAQEISSYKIITYQVDKIPLSYQNVVLARWLRSLKRLNEYFYRVDNNAYFSVYEKYLKVILSRKTAEARFAVLTEDEDVVLGWSIVEGTALHYVHVQELNRRAGIATSLIPSDIEFITHVTRHWDKFLGKKYKTRFNPFI